jgi:bifunctional non-homologous end joining protein LigD
LSEKLEKLKKVHKPIKAKLLDEKISTWVDSKMIAEISYSSLTKDKMFREPVFVRLREDMDY